VRRFLRRFRFGKGKTKAAKESPHSKTRIGAMIACVDVDYRDAGAVAACVAMGDWADAESQIDLVARIEHVEEYVPGQFFRRELPCLKNVLASLPAPPHVIVVDGYVWLADESMPGLGAHLFDALGRTVAVVGVAKTQFRGATAARPVLRGTSRRPLYVTSAGMPIVEACQHIQAMHGPFRIPTLLKKVDQLCREG
jgi:deoxyribonuclease V